MGISAGEAFVTVTPELSGFAGALQTGMARLLPGLGANIGAMFGAGVVVGAGIELFHLGQEFEHAFDTIRERTGAQGKQLDSLKDSFKNVYANVPAAMAPVADTIAAINQRLGLTGPPLEKLATQVLNLSRVTKTDLNANIALVPQLLNNWNVPGTQAANTLNLVFRASQQTGIGVDELMGQSTKFGAVLRALHIPLGDALALIGGLNKVGVDAAPIMMGLNKAVAGLAKKGEDPTETLHRVFEEIRLAKDPVAATGEAVQLFGTRAGVKLADAIRAGRFSIDDLSKSIANGHDTISKAEADTEHLGEKFDKLWHKIQVGIEPVATALVDGLGKAFDWLSTHWPEISAAFDDFINTLRDIWDKFGKGWLDSVRSVWDEVKGIFKVFSGLLSGDWSQVWDGLKDIFKGAWEGIKGTAETAWAALSGIFSAGGHLISAAWDALWSGIKDAANAAWDGIKSAATFLFVTLPKAIWDGITAGAKFLWDKLVSFGDQFGNALGAIIDGALDIGKNIIHAIWTGITNTAGWLWDKLKGFVKDVINALNPFSSPQRFAYYIGVDIATDYSAGMVAGMPKVAPAAAELVGTVADALPRVQLPLLPDNWAASLAPMQSAQSAGAAPTVNIENLHQYANDPTELAPQLIDELTHLMLVSGR